MMVLPLRYPAEPLQGQDDTTTLIGVVIPQQAWGPVCLCEGHQGRPPASSEGDPGFRNHSLSSYACIASPCILLWSSPMLATRPPMAAQLASMVPLSP